MQLDQNGETLRIDEIPRATYNQLEDKYGNNVDMICGDHEKLVGIILEEEEELINGHR